MSRHTKRININTALLNSRLNKGLNIDIINTELNSALFTIMLILPAKYNSEIEMMQMILKYVVKVFSAQFCKTTTKLRKLHVAKLIK